MQPGTWYARLSPEARAAYIARASANVTRKRAENRKLGLCVCGEPLRKIRPWLYAAMCEGCYEANRARRRRHG